MKWSIANQYRASRKERMKIQGEEKEKPHSPLFFFRFYVSMSKTRWRWNGEKKKRKQTCEVVRKQGRFCRESNHERVTLHWPSSSHRDENWKKKKRRSFANTGGRYSVHALTRGWKKKKKRNSNRWEIRGERESERLLFLLRFKSQRQTFLLVRSTRQLTCQMMS